MDWVEERAHRDQIISESAENLWNDLCSAIEESVKSMQRLYEKSPVKVSFEKVHENKAVVHLGNGAKYDCTFTYDPKSHEIVVGLGIYKNKHRIVMESDQQRAWLSLDGQRSTANEIAKRILEPLFFPEEN